MSVHYCQHHCFEDEPSGKIKTLYSPHDPSILPLSKQETSRERFLVASADSPDGLFRRRVSGRGGLGGFALLGGVRGARRSRRPGRAEGVPLPFAGAGCPYFVILLLKSNSLRRWYYYYYYYYY